MNHPSRVPEYSVEESVKTLHMAKLQDSFVQDLQVDIQVLYQELTKLEGFCGRIVDDIRVLALSQRGTQ